MHRVSLICAFLLALCSIVACQSSTLYGIVTVLGGGGTQTNVITVQVDLHTGNFTYLSTNFVNIGDSATYDGISGYDQKDNILYYASDFGSAFVFAVDTAANANGPPISIGADGLQSIVYDSVNQQMLFTGLYGNSCLLVSFPSDPSQQSIIVLNYTTIHLNPNDIFAQTMNTVTGDYTVIFNDGTGLAIGWFNVGDAESSFQYSAMDCKPELYPTYVQFDAKLNKFVGVGSNTYGTDYYFFEYAGGKCTTVDLKLKTGAITANTYDPTTYTLYISYTDNSGAYLYMVDSSTHKVAHIVTEDVLEDIEVSYSL